MLHFLVPLDRSAAHDAVAFFQPRFAVANGRPPTTASDRLRKRRLKPGAATVYQTHDSVTVGGCLAAVWAADGRRTGWRLAYSLAAVMRRTGRSGRAACYRTRSRCAARAVRPGDRRRTGWRHPDGRRQAYRLAAGVQAGGSHPAIARDRAPGYVRRRVLNSLSTAVDN